MSRYDYDLLTLGAGSGGVAASRRAGSHGAKVAICEELRVGGTCVLRGCVPKKLLVYATHFREELEDARGYGWSVPEAKLDWAALIAAKDRELDRLNGVYLKLLADAKVELLDGRGVVVDPHTVEVAGRRYTAERILVATGGWPWMPDIPGVEHAITSNEALDLDRLPEHVTIVGAGYIGVEFAGIFAAAGSKVTMVVRGDELLRGFDVDLRTTLADEMRARGIELLFRQHIHAIARREGRLSLTLDGGESLLTDTVLYATGRHPKSSGIGLPEVGVALDAWGAVKVDEWSRTSVPSIFAIGDVTTRPALTPVAIADGRSFAETEFNRNPRPVDHTTIATAVFSNPPIGTVGLTEEQAIVASAGPVDIYRARFRPMKYVLPARESRTMMKLVVERETDRVLGAHMIGPDAPEIIQGFAVAVKAGLTKKQFDATMAIHPTAAEEFVTMTTPVSR